MFSRQYVHKLLNGMGLTALLVQVVSCSGGASGVGGSGEVFSSLTEGYAVPQSISAIPAESSNISPLIAALNSESLEKKLMKIVSDPSDYDKAGVLELKVDEPALDKFSIIESIMKVLKQTNYWESRVVNKGPYKALVRWDSDSGGYSYEMWTIDSKMIVLDGKDVNRVNFWIPPESGRSDNTRGKIDIFQAPTVSNQYGEWRLDVSMDEEGPNGEPGTFSAEAKPHSDGEVKISIKSDFDASGVLFLKNDSGKGFVHYYDWSNCQTENCLGTPVDAKMAYNANHAVVQKDDGAAQCKDRTSYSDVYMEYMIFDSTGKDINKVKTYNFPLKYNSKYFYYSGWNGRQQLWGEGASDLPTGTVLNHGGYNNNSTYKIDSRVKGILTKKSGSELYLQGGSTDSLSTMSDVFEHHSWQDSKYFYLAHNGTEWRNCINFDWGSKTCGGDPATWSSLAGLNIANVEEIFLAHGTQNTRVMVSAVDDSSWKNLVEKASGADDPSKAISFRNSLDTNKIYMVNMSKIKFIKYESGWKSCSADFKTNAWDPPLSSCVNFDWNEIAMSWGKISFNFWTRSGTQYLAQIDESTDANDGHAGTGALLKLVKLKEEVIKEDIAGDLKKKDHLGNIEATYVFTGGQLKVKSNGDVVTTWAGQFYDNDGNEYNWSYSDNGGDWDKMTYLSYQDNAPAGKARDDLVVFDEPLRFNSVSAKKVDGTSVDLKNLVYDGWLHGLTDIWDLLRENRNNNSDAGLSPEQKTRIINIPAADIVDSSGTTYKIKPRYGMRILDFVDSGCSASIDNSISLSDGITYIPHGVGVRPVIEEVTVMEGKFVSDY